MVSNTLRFTPNAKEDLELLKSDPSQIKRLKTVLRTLGLMETNLRHPSLNAHEFKSLKGPKGEISIIAITPHP